MHSHERTLLASLGFQDRDKGDQRHDLACQYLRTQENALALFSRFLPDALSLGAKLEASIKKVEELRQRFAVPEWFAQKTRCIRGEDAPGDPDVVAAKHHALEIYRSIGKRFFCTSVRLLKASVESHITKGRDQYRTTIGFADLILSFSAATVNITSLPEDSYYSSRDCNDLFWYPLRICRFPEDITFLLEVKIHPLPVGDIMRQINLYREYCRTDGTVIACAFPLPKDDIQSLLAERIHYIRLGARFEQFCEERKRASEGAAEDSRGHEL